ncbi:MAG: hypothetical protein E4G90_00360 [Gemmatimonadales bacterium]|nr:MAG: hypothetical protein E4G90_00360 [Gemmatimonadales bacterium]
MGTRILTLIGLILAGGALSSARAQEPWKASYYPDVLKGPNEKTALVLHYQYSQAADYFDRVPFAHSLSIEAGANPDGGRAAVVHFKAPRLADGWRAYAEGGSVREARYGFFGLGNDTEKLADPDNRHINQVRRTRHFLRAGVTRRIVGDLHFAVGGSLTSANYSVLPGNSRFASDCPSIPVTGGSPSVCGDDTDLVGRSALVFDTRDREFVTSKGVFLEAGAFAGTGGDGYQGVYGIAKGFVSPKEGTVLAARVVGRHLEPGAPLDARAVIPAWERDIPVLGGPESHRSFPYGRFAGLDLLMMNFEVRQDILNLGDFGAFTAVGFLDAGRVAEDGLQESSDFHVGGGAGLAIRILRSTVLTLNFAWGGDGFLYSMGTGWSF